MEMKGEFKMHCVGCNSLLKKTGSFNICDTCYSHSIIRVDDGGLIQVENRLPDENESLTAEDQRRITEVFSNTSNIMVANRRRSQDDVDLMCKLGMSLRQFCVHKIKNKLNDGKFYVFIGYEYPGVNYSKLPIAVREELMRQMQVEEWEFRIVQYQLFEKNWSRDT